MKISPVLSLFAVATCAVSAAALQARDQQPLLRTNEGIPGSSPVEICPGSSTDDFILQIQSIDLTPNPPIPGQVLLIQASGVTNETIDEGAYVLLEVKWGYVRLIHTKADLCEEIKNVDMECPVKDGEINISKEVDIPKEVPPGKYNVKAEVFNKDDKPITCLTASVVFSKQSSMFFK